MMLNDLHDDDEFTIVTFSSDVQQWKRTFQPVDDDSRAEAKAHVQRLLANGGKCRQSNICMLQSVLGTNINDAMLTTLQIMNEETDKVPLIVFLTDGQATSGVTDAKTMLQNMKVCKITIALILLQCFVERHGTTNENSAHN
jgi:hypothetical protein